ncbi:hypothetical protein [Dickeya solani]|uniref:Uncharacterized protein n=1 Tax=Dickeya solani TaxID=1089444 RepID=A0ABU4EL67_9GAMM|nr:hypothetical protein [Dickeya solani]MCA6998210.1 hypothetical protein [Dickeya solani]MDV6997159.1 hypothetical protein [Dickeya solani]MDV7004470.1 hypothetical protein [Dickeya solani]MDV7040368.1 hypothetical protein [Dickeya solani]MDV7044819.1 hypothetical protein [Dickeya solani]
MKDKSLPDFWTDDDGNMCRLIGVVEDEGRRLVVYKFINKKHLWDYVVKPESHVVFKLID